MSLLIWFWKSIIYTVLLLYILFSETSIALCCYWMSLLRHNLKKRFYQGLSSGKSHSWLYAAARSAPFWLTGFIRKDLNIPVLRGKDSIGCMTEDNNLKAENSFRGSKITFKLRLLGIIIAQEQLEKCKTIMTFWHVRVALF